MVSLPPIFFFFFLFLYKNGYNGYTPISWGFTGFFFGYKNGYMRLQKWLQSLETKYNLGYYIPVYFVYSAVAPFFVTFFSLL